MQCRKRKAEEKKGNGSKKDKNIMKKKHKGRQIIETKDERNENKIDDGTSEGSIAKSKDSDQKITTEK